MEEIPDHIEKLGDIQSIPVFISKEFLDRNSGIDKDKIKKCNFNNSGDKLPSYLSKIKSRGYDIKAVYINNYNFNSNIQLYYELSTNKSKLQAGRLEGKDGPLNEIDEFKEMGSTSIILKDPVECLLVLMFTKIDKKCYYIYLEQGNKPWSTFPCKEIPSGKSSGNIIKLINNEIGLGLTSNDIKTFSQEIYTSPGITNETFKCSICIIDNFVDYFPEFWNQKMSEYEKQSQTIKYKKEGDTFNKKSFY